MIFIRIEPQDIHTLLLHARDAGSTEAADRVEKALQQAVSSQNLTDCADVAFIGEQVEDDIRRAAIAKAPRLLDSAGVNNHIQNIGRTAQELIDGLSSRWQPSDAETELADAVSPYGIVSNGTRAAA